METRKEQSTTSVAKTETQQLAPSQRFVQSVEKELSGGNGLVKLTDFQKRLAQNYFVAIDSTLKVAEEKRLAKAEKYRDALPVTWVNVNMEALYRNIIAVARIGLDPMQKNHINMIPYKNNKSNKYDIVFLEGYAGLELKAKKYGLEIPDDVLIEVVYSKDTFKPLKKSITQPFDSYEFVINNPFDRGEVVGGFYYYLFASNPSKNKLEIFSKKDIEKRKPKNASAEFWGGEKTKWENGKEVGKEHVEGWYEQMVHKTIARAAYSGIVIDSQKIDDDYLRLKENEVLSSQLEAKAEIEQNANTEILDISHSVVEEEVKAIPENNPQEEIQPNTEFENEKPEAETVQENKPEPKPKKPVAPKEQQPQINF